MFENEIDLEYAKFIQTDEQILIIDREKFKNI